MAELASQLPSAPRRAIKVNATRGEEEFARARRRTRLVKWLKIALPAVAIVGIGGFLAAYLIGTQGVGFSMSGLSVDAKSLTIDKPRVSGFKGTARSYDLSAARAVQDLTNPKMVRLEQIAGSFGVQTDGSATMAAGTGIFDSAAETLILKDGIAVKTTTGYDLSLSEAAIDFRQNTLVSDMPIVIKTAEGEIHANSVRISKGGHTIRFDNGVTVTYMPKAGDGIAAGPTQADQ